MSSERQNGWGRMAGVALAAFVLGRISGQDSTPAPVVTVPAEVAAPGPELQTDNPQAGEGAAPDPPPQVAVALPAPAPPASSRWADVETSADSIETPSSGDFTCSGKHLCRQMNSCEEANFYLRQCGVGRLDGDGDGVPCESIC